MVDAVGVLPISPSPDHFRVRRETSLSQVTTRGIEMGCVLAASYAPPFRRYGLSKYQYFYILLVL